MRTQQAVDEQHRRARRSAPGSASKTRNCVMNTIQTKRGKRRMLIPGARKSRMVTIKLIAATIDPIPRMNSPSA